MTLAYAIIWYRIAGSPIHVEKLVFTRADEVALATPPTPHRCSRGGRA